MDAEEGLAAYYFDTSIVQVERIMRRDGFRFNNYLLVEIERIVRRDGFELNDCLIVEAIRDREVG